MLFAESEFELSQRLDDGSTIRHHLECEFRQTGIMPEQLRQPEFPVHLEQVWSYFSELNRARCGNGFGANPLSYVEIAAWNSLTDAQVTPLEVQIIRALDNLYLTKGAG